MVASSSTVTRKGQVTVPIEIRRVLGIKQGDRVIFELDHAGIATLKRGDGFTDRTAGIFRTDAPPPSAEELRALAADAIAGGAMERGGG